MASSTQIDAAIRVLLSAKDSASPEIDKVKASIGGLEDKTKSSNAAMHALVAGGATALVGILGDSARVAAASEVSIVRLSTAMTNAGLSASSLAVADEEITKRSIRLGFSMNEQRDSLSRLVTVTHDVNKALALQALAMDIARARGIDLAAATLLVTKVSEGHFAAAAKMGIVIKENSTAEEALAQLQEAYANSAENQSKTVVVASERVKNAYEALQEAAFKHKDGLELISSFLPGLKAGYIGLVASIAFFTATKEAENGAIALTQFQTVRLTIAHAAHRVAVLASAAATAVLSGAMRLLNITFLLSPVGLIVVGITALVAVFVILYKTVEPVRNLLNNLWEGFLKLLGPIGDVVKIVGGKAAEAFKGVTNTIGLTSDKTKEATKDLAKLGDAGVAAATKASTAFSRMNDALKAQFAPASAMSTRQLLESYGISETAIIETLDTIYDTVGASEATRTKKVTDVAYKTQAEQVRAEILGPIEKTIADVAAMSEEQLAKIAKAAGQTPTEYIDRTQKELADAQARFELFSKRMAEHTEQARHNAKSVQELMDPHVKKIHDIKDAWNVARDAADLYANSLRNISGNITTSITRITREVREGDGGTDTGGGGGNTGYADGGWVKRTEMALVHQGEYVVPRKDVGALGGTTVISPSITLNYTGNGEADQSVAAAMASSVVDQVTEILRQQGRRVGNRLSPFGAS